MGDELWGFGASSYWKSTVIVRQSPYLMVALVEDKKSGSQFKTRPPDEFITKIFLLSILQPVVKLLCNRHNNKYSYTK